MSALQPTLNSNVRLITAYIQKYTFAALSFDLTEVLTHSSSSNIV